MTSDTPVVSVVTPTYNRADRAERLLDAFARLDLPDGPFEVLLVDDGSSDGTAERLQARVSTSPFPLRLLRLDENAGPARARNLGWQAATAPFVAFIDDDCVPEPGWLTAGVRRLTSDPQLGVLQGQTKIEADIDPLSVPVHTVCRYVYGPTPNFEACNILYRRDALAATGGFDESIRWFGEDSAAGWRVVEGGWARGYEPDAVVYHDVEFRGLGWHVRHGYLERNVVRLAAEHPGFRKEYFWRPWAVERDAAALTIALAGLVGALRWKPLALAAVPYLWWRRPSVRRPEFFRIGARTVLLDGAKAAGHLVGSLKHRVFVL